MARYGEAMIDDPARPGTVESLESALRDKLAQGEAMAGSVVPVLRYLVANEDNSIFADEIVARVRGMVGDLAVQLLDKRAEAGGMGEPGDHAAERVGALSKALVADAALLRHVHALALEWQLTERLQARLSLDPVLPPLQQALIASPESTTAELAMKLLAAQARFGQSQRRMKLPLAELPADLLHTVLVRMRELADAEDDRGGVEAEVAIRASYDESRSRLGLISRLVISMGGGAVAALSISHSGIAVFLSALAFGCGLDRDLVTLSTNETQLARFALSLRAAGLKPSAVEEQFLAVHPDIPLPEGFDRLDADRAAALLAVAGGHWGP